MSSFSFRILWLFTEENPWLASFKILIQIWWRSHFSMTGINHTHSHTYTSTYTHTHTHTHTQVHTHTHTHSHTYTSTHTHTLTHIHKYIHTCYYTESVHGRCKIQTVLCWTHEIHSYQASHKIHPLRHCSLHSSTVSSQYMPKLLMKFPLRFSHIPNRHTVFQ